MKRYHIWLGTRLPDKFQFDTLGEVLTFVFEQGRAIAGPVDVKRVRVFDRNPGWMHPLFDSKELE